MLFPDENELFYVISIDAIDVLQVLCKKWVRFRSQICQIRLSDPFVTKTQAVWVAVDFQVSADEGGGIHP